MEGESTVRERGSEIKRRREKERDEDKKGKERESESGLRDVTRTLKIVVC